MRVSAILYLVIGVIFSIFEPHFPLRGAGWCLAFGGILLFFPLRKVRWIAAASFAVSAGIVIYDAVELRTNDIVHSLVWTLAMLQPILRMFEASRPPRKRVSKKDRLRIALVSDALRRNVSPEEVKAALVKSGLPESDAENFCSVVSDGLRVGMAMDATLPKKPSWGENVVWLEAFGEGTRQYCEVARGAEKSR